MSLAYTSVCLLCHLEVQFTLDVLVAAHLAPHLVYALAGLVLKQRQLSYRTLHALYRNASLCAAMVGTYRSHALDSLPIRQFAAGMIADSLRPGTAHLDLPSPVEMTCSCSVLRQQLSKGWHDQAWFLLPVLLFMLFAEARGFPHRLHTKLTLC